MTDLGPSGPHGPGPVTRVTAPEAMPRARRRRFAPTARARIVGWSTLLVAVALAISVVVAGQVLLSRVDSRLTTELEHEGDKLRSYSASAVDPRTGQPFSNAGDLLTAFLRDNLPDHAETFFSVVDGHAARRSPQTPLARLDTDQDVVDMAAAAQRPTRRTVSTTAGPAMIGIFPVRMAGGAGAAALVVVEFVAPARAEAWSIIRLLAAISFGALVIAGLAAWIVAGRVLQPIRDVRHTAERIGQSDLSSRIAVTGNDDVAYLARTFNRMLDRLQTAFTTQRDFLNDAGHELRTPLTIIRGHLELMGDDPAERAQTMPLVLDEIDRMRRLVDDLTTLAQADRPDFVRADEVDLTGLIVDLVAKASAMAPRHWHIDAVAEGTVRADEQRLTQALMQLAVNAVAHTGTDDTISAGSSVDGAVVRLWVRDNGSGIPLDEQERIFERSARGSTATRGSGSGLGLAIVTAIAAAHDGEVSVDSTPGFGATFTMTIPVDAGSSTSAPHPPQEELTDTPEPKGTSWQRS